MAGASVVCLCVCKLFCGNRYYYAKNGSIATKVAQDGQQVGAHPSCAQGQGQGQRSRASGSFVPARKRFSSQGNGRIETKLAHDGLQVSLHPGCAQGQGQSQRSRDTGTFVLDLKSLFLAGKRLDCDLT